MTTAHSDSQPAASVASILEEALTLHGQGALDPAEILYRRIVSMEPNHFTAIHCLGVIQSQRGEYEEAVRLIGEALRWNPRSAMAHLNLGIALGRLNRPEQALDHYRYSLILKPNHPETLLNCALAFHSLRRNEEALVGLDKLFAIQPESPEVLLNRGIVLQELQRSGEALESFERALVLKPEDPAVLLNLGIVLGELNRPEEAVARFDQALACRPEYPEALYQRGFIRQGQGRYGEALADYQRALALRPQWIEALANRATVLHLTHRDDEALAHLERVLALSPELPEGLLNCGIVLRDLRRPGEALACFDRLLALQPDHVEAHLNRGKALGVLQRSQEALTSFDEALARQPHHVGTLMDRGNTLKDLQRPQEALASLDQALALQPDNPDILSNRGAVLLTLGHPAEALADCDRAIALKPGHGDALLNKGTALLALKRPSDALASYDLALALKPDWVEAIMSRGTALVELHRTDEAMISYDLALALQPDHVETLLNRGTALHRLGRNQEAVASFDRALAMQPDHVRVWSNKIFVMDYLPEVDFQAHQRVRHEYFLSRAKSLPAAVQTGTRDRNPVRPLVLGYVSADFKRHSAASCFGPVLHHHDRNAFRIVCYSGTTLEDDWTRDFQSAADGWRRTAGLSDDAMAALIRSDGVDILIDLSGHSEGNRLPVFARKPAPIQVTAWGHGGGTGLPMIDYQFTDPVIIPPEVRPLFAEASFDLPCCITFEAPVYAPGVRDLPACSQGFVTFGSLNRYLKVTSAVMELWAQILREVPHARLLMKDGALDDPEAQARVRAVFTVHGIAPERVLLRGFSSHQDHLAVYNEVDIVLDTFPQNGGITTWEALWMGAPVIAMLGNKLVSRISGSILHALDLDEWIAGNEADYLRLAVAQASDLPALALLRQSLRTRILASSAGNTELYTRAVEEAYRAMWKRWLAQ